MWVRVIVCVWVYYLVLAVITSIKNPDFYFSIKYELGKSSNQAPWGPILENEYLWPLFIAALVKQ